jgi:hypothetical protein
VRLLPAIAVISAVSVSSAAAVQTRTRPVPARPAAQPTQQFHYTPFDANGDVRPALHVTSRSGQCFSSSDADVRSDTWRCIAGNLILDPCFESPVQNNMVLCVGSPWDRKAIKLHAVLHQSDRFDGHPGPPWALELAGRRHCVFATGATDVLHGRRLNYVCGRPGKGAVLWGKPDRRRAQWLIHISSNFSGKHMHRIAIRQAWR